MDEKSSGSNISTVAGEIILAVLLTLLIIAVFGNYINGALGIYGGILDWLHKFNWNLVNDRLSIVFSFFNLVLIAFIAVVMKIYYRTKEESVAPPAEPAKISSPKDEVKENWEHVQELINSTNGSDWNMAVLRADALLDDVLIKLGYEGETIADRLKIVDPHQLPSIERIWSAHRLRNSIAHNPLEQNSREAMTYAIKGYEQALKELGFMEEEGFPK